MLTVALFGTSADPPTIGHQMVLEWLAHRFDHVAVWAADNPFKEHQTPLVHRQAMMERLVSALQDQFPQIQLYPDLSDPRSINTLKIAHQRWPEAEFTLVVGSDVLLSLKHWYRAEELLSQVRLLVIPRPGAPLSAAMLDSLQQQMASFVIADFTGPDVSSSHYRATGNLAEVTPAVATYIRQQSLYLCQEQTRR